jgi:hypothetical protein
MVKLMYRCPRTGVSVDIWLADEVTPVNADTGWTGDALIFVFWHVIFVEQMQDLSSIPSGR